MIPKDFRYVLDGEEIEAIQLTKESRYAQKQWPDWLDPRMLVTYDHGEQRLKVGEQETVIPELGWIAKTRKGVTVIDPFEMEAAAKVVDEVQVVHPRADANIRDEDLAKMHDIELPFDHVDELERANKYHPPELGQPAVPDNVTVLSQPSSDRGLLLDARTVFELLRADKVQEAADKLRGSLSHRANWCNCPPGQCNGTVDDTWDCRENSPLAK